MKILKVLKIAIVIILLSDMVYGGISTIRSNIYYNDTAALTDEQNYNEIVRVENSDVLISDENINRLKTLIDAMIFESRYDEALELVRESREIEDSLSTRFLELKILLGLNDYETYSLLSNETLNAYANEYDSLSIDDKFIYNTLIRDNGNYLVAIKNYREFLREDISEDMYRLILDGLALSYLEIYNYDESKKYAELALEMSPEDVVVLVHLGQAYYGLGNYSAARIAYEKAYEFIPNNKYCNFFLASTLTILKEERALKYWENYSEIYPIDTNDWYGFSENYLSSNDTNGEVIIAEMLFNQSPNYRTCLALARLYDKHNLSDKIDPIIKIAKNNLDEYNGLLLDAYISYNYKSKDEGLRIYRDIFDACDIEFETTYYIVNSAYAEETDELFLELLDLVSLRYGNACRLLVEMELYHMYDNYDSAKESAEKLLQCDPNYFYAYEILGNYYYYHVKQYEEAISSYEKAIQLGAETYYMKKALVDSLIILNRLEDAGTLVEELISENSTDNALYVYRARINAIKGDDELALEDLHKAFIGARYLAHYLDEYEELTPFKEDNEIKRRIH